jgi:serine-type D-Ala-D-Ala carboxypeptidase (penicillin-binding protein 5/6)
MTRAIAIGAVLVTFVATAAIAVAIWPDRDTDGGVRAAAGARSTTTAPERGTDADGIRGNSRTGVRGPGSRSTAAHHGPVIPPVVAPPDLQFTLEPVARPLPVQPRLKHPPAAGVLFDIDSGEVLWQRRARAEHPIASLTKMMTALLVAEHDPPAAKVMISAKASHTPGSATGLLPRGRTVPLEPLLEALIMISANDAAVALAEHDAGTVTRFVKQMNRRAVSMGLYCTHFSTPNGLRDRDNYSCPADLAVLARADLANPRIARIARTSYARPRFPIKGHRLHLANNHYFLQRGLSGVPGAQVTGLKTGFTDGAGRCYVTTARLGGRELGVVVLDSPDPLRQVPALLRDGFQEVGALPAPSRPQRPPGRR